jgi:hypothetical protein
MAKKTDTWNKTCNRFVAFLDIMGFKNLVMRSNHQELYELLKSFQPTVAMIENDAKSILAKEIKIENIPLTRPVLFSDSIILISNDDSSGSANSLLFEVKWIMYRAMIKGIPMKGAIAYGEQTADFEKSLHFGRPLIDAYELQSELLLYSVVLHHTAEKRLIESDQIEWIKDFSIFNYPVPMKTGKITHYVINWVLFRGEQVNIVDLVSKLYSNVSGASRLYIDNTLDWIKWLNNRKIELDKSKYQTNLL